MFQRRNRLLGVSALLLASLLLVYLADFYQLPRTAVWVLAAAGAESILAFIGLVWALRRSNLLFLSVFYGGTLFRLASIGVAAIVLTALDLSPVVPLLSLVGGYFILSMVQLPFISHELR